MIDQPQPNAAPLLSRRNVLGTVGLGTATVAASVVGVPTAAHAKPKGQERVNVRDLGAVGDGVTDDTAAFNNAIAALTHGGVVFVPSGLYLIDPAISIVVKTGLTLLGEGDNASVLTAKPVAGTIIRRNFNPAGPNNYLQDVCIKHLAVVMNHPANATPGNYAQIGIDFRNVTRSSIIESYVGNYSRGSLVKPPPVNQADNIQGYGIVIGNVSSGTPAYAGGEVNSVVRCTVWGAKKAIVLDDLVLSPASAAHATLVEACDVQICELGIGTESIYTAGCTFTGNIVQAVTRAPGSTATTYNYRIAGYDNLLDGGYIESPQADHKVYLDAGSKRNRVGLSHYSVEGGVTDLGTANYIEYIDRSANRHVKSFNKIPQRTAWVTFDSAGTIMGSSDVSSVARLGVGHYQVNWAPGFPSANYSISGTGKVTAGGLPTVVSVVSQSASAVVLKTFELGVSGAAATDIPTTMVVAQLA